MMRKKGKNMRGKGNDKMGKKGKKVRKKGNDKATKMRIFTSLLLIVPPRWSGSPKIADGRKS